MSRSNQVYLEPGIRETAFPTLVGSRAKFLAMALAACLLPMFHAAPARAQSEQEQIAALRREVEQLRQELDALKAEVRHNSNFAASADPLPAKNVDASIFGTPSLARQKPQASADAPQYPTTPAQTSDQGEADQSSASNAADLVPLLQSEIADQAQTKIGSNSRLPVRLFGTVVAGTFYNTNEGDWRDVTTTVDPPPAPPLKPGSFNATLRQSRVGAIVDLPTIGSMKASGLMAMDFYGGSPDIKNGTTIGSPRLLYAYVRLQGKKNAIEIGQDEMIFAPRNPTSIASYAIPELYRTGNLYLRVPQARIEHEFDTGKNSEILAIGGILAPASSYAYGAYFGGNIRQPAFQARVAWRTKPADPGEEPTLEFGLSGHYGHEIYTGQPVTSSGGAFDFNANHNRFGATAELYLGENLGAMGGAIGQAGKSDGGFFEGRFKATPRLDFNAGVGTDRVNREYNTDPTLLRTNDGVYANTIFHFTPEIATSFEYRWLSTTPVSGPARRNNHIDMVFAYSF